MNEKWLNICRKYNCVNSYCIQKTRKNCKHEFWKKECLYYSEHLYLNKDILYGCKEIKK